MPYFYDWTYIFLLPAIIFSLYAQSKIKNTYRRYSEETSYRGISGAEAAREILDKNNLYNVPIEVTGGTLSDHYDPISRTLRLSKDVYFGKSIASIGVAAHEAGHAIQHNTGYVPLIFRNSLVPVANIGSSLSWIFILLGIFINMSGLINIGILLFTAAVLFQIVTLPVEFNASSRAIRQIETSGILYDNEVHKAKEVLNAAALTYVAATLTAVLQLVRLLVMTRNSRD